MVKENAKTCPNCGGRLVKDGHVDRIVRTKGRETKWIKLQRLLCANCGKVHREIPDIIFPYKQYEAELIQGVWEGLITTDTYGYEDYPCETTMKRWKSLKTQEKQLLL